MANPGVKVQFSADDRLSGAIERINQRLARLHAPVERTQRALGRFGQLSGLRAVGGGLERVGGTAQSAFLSLGRILPVLGTITGAATLAGMVRLAGAWADFGSHLGFSAQRLGLSSDRLQTLTGAARLAGSSADAMQSGMQTLGQGMVDAVGGRDPKLFATFNALNVKWRDLRGNALSVDKVLPQVIDHLRAIHNPMLRAEVATTLFGGAAEALMPVINMGSEAFATLQADAKRYGVMNQAGVDAANRLRVAQTELTLSVEGFGNSIAQALEPVLTPIIHRMAELIAANRGWIATDIAGYVGKFAGWVERTWPQPPIDLASASTLGQVRSTQPANLPP